MQRTLPPSLIRTNEAIRFPFEVMILDVRVQSSIVKTCHATCVAAVTVVVSVVWWHNLLTWDLQCEISTNFSHISPALFVFAKLDVIDMV